AKSSGTTNAKSKFIPVSNEALEDCHYKSSKDLLCLYLNNNENSQLFNGKSLRLGGSKELFEDNGTFFGDLSAILRQYAPLGRVQQYPQQQGVPDGGVGIQTRGDHPGEHQGKCHLPG